MLGSSMSSVAETVTRRTSASPSPRARRTSWSWPPSPSWTSPTTASAATLTGQVVFSHVGRQTGAPMYQVMVSGQFISIFSRNSDLTSTKCSHILPKPLGQHKINHSTLSLSLSHIFTTITITLTFILTNIIYQHISPFCNFSASFFYNSLS